MPSLLTHHWFANQIISHFQARFPFLHQHASAVWLGAQGPDPFFFYGRAPFHSRAERTAINQFGSTLHNDSLDKTLWKLIETYHTQPDHAHLAAYVVGALTHYVLDSVVHPYVFYRSGFDQDGQLTGRYGYDHARLEVAMDIALIDHYKLSNEVYQPKQTLRIPLAELEHISQFYEQTYPQTLKTDTFTLAVKDMKNSYKFLYHAGLFRQMLIHLVSGRYGLAKGLIHTKGQSKEWSSRVLNLDHLPWHHPVSKEVSKLSCIELFEEASKKMEALIERIVSPSAFIEEAYLLHDYDGKPFGSTLQHFRSYFL